MKKIALAAAAVALSGMMMVSAPREAKADGGVVIASVATYLLVDALVGKECRMHAWPFNFVTKVAYGVKGYNTCRKYRRHRR